MSRIVAEKKLMVKIQLTVLLFLTSLTTQGLQHINNFLTHGHGECHTGSSMVSLRKGVEYVAVCDTCVGENRHSSLNCLSRVFAPFIAP